MESVTKSFLCFHQFNLYKNLIIKWKWIFISFDTNWKIFQEQTVSANSHDFLQL